jgi:hypothetical protein
MAETQKLYNKNKEKYINLGISYETFTKEILVLSLVQKKFLYANSIGEHDTVNPLTS